MSFLYFRKTAILSLLSVLFIAGIVLSCKDKAVNPQNSSEDTKSDFVNIKIEWNPVNFPLEMKIYEIKSQMPHELWETRSVKSIENSPASTEIPNASFVVQSGRYKEFIVGLKNTTDKPVYFFAAPHQVNPPEFSLGFKFKCLCINHAFSVGPGEFWYRVVRMNIDKDFRGKGFAIKHDLVGISEERMKDFSLDKQGDSKEHGHSETVDK